MCEDSMIGRYYQSHTYCRRCGKPLFSFAGIPLTRDDDVICAKCTEELSQDDY